MVSVAGIQRRAGKGLVLLDSERRYCDADQDARDSGQRHTHRRGGPGGASFRDAHAAIGSLIRESERDGCELDALPIASFRAAHSLFGDDVLDWLEPARSVARRDVPGGTGPEAVRAQLRSAREALWPVAEVARGNELILRAV